MTEYYEYNNNENSNWRDERRLFYFIILSVMTIMVVAYYIYSIFFSVINCNDGKKNGEEKGVDCGGECQLICKIETLPIYINKNNLKLERISDNKYNISFIINNDNNDTIITGINIEVKLFDKYNNLLNTIYHKIDNADNKLISNTISNIEQPNLYKAQLSIYDNYKIYKSPNNISTLKLLSFDQEDVGGKHKITIKYMNPNIKSVNNAKVSLVLYNKNDNLIYIYRDAIGTLKLEEIKTNIFYIPNNTDRVNSVKILLNYL